MLLCFDEVLLPLICAAIRGAFIILNALGCLDCSADEGGVFPTSMTDAASMLTIVPEEPTSWLQGFVGMMVELHNQAALAQRQRLAAEPQVQVFL